MIRIFAPPTRDVFLRPDPTTVGTFIVHVAVCVLLLVPLSRVAQEQIFDRLVVFLVPPQAQPGERQREMGEATIHAVAPEALPRGSSDREGNADPLPAKGATDQVSPTEVVAPGTMLPGDNALSVLEVDSTVLRDPSSAAPEYPRNMLDQRIEGSATVRFVVDTTGIVDTLTYRVLRATHADFAVAVRLALPGMKFRPAIRGGNRVRQLVEQPFSFRITPRDTSLPVAPPKPPA